MTDPHNLIQRLADALHQQTCLYDGYENSLVSEARAYLAQPEPAAGPTDEELDALANQAWIRKEILEEYGSIENAFDCCAFVRAVLARYGHQPPQPIPLSERLPGPEDCDGMGRCWWIEFDQQWFAAWVCDSVPPRRATHWLPAHALPLPDVKP